MGDVDIKGVEGTWRGADEIKAETDKDIERIKTERKKRAEEKERDDAKSKKRKKVINIEDDCTLRNLYRTMEFFSDKRATGYTIPTYENAMDRMGFKDDEEIEKTFEYIIDNYKTMPMPCEIREALVKVREKKPTVDDDDWGLCMGIG